MTWEIDKTFEFCYGHRVHSQTLNGVYSDDLKCACRHLHGHEGKVHVFLTGEQLDHTGMITDFRHLEWLKKLINSVIDHQFIIDKNDPLYDKIVGIDKSLIPVIIDTTSNIDVTTKYVIGYNVDMTEIPKNTPEFEYYEGLFIVEFVPTSENLSKWIADFVDFKMKDLNVAVSKVDWWETPKSRASYKRESPVYVHGIRIK